MLILPMTDLTHREAVQLAAGHTAGITSRQLSVEPFP